MSDPYHERQSQRLLCFQAGVWITLWLIEKTGLEIQSQRNSASLLAPEKHHHQVSGPWRTIRVVFWFLFLVIFLVRKTSLQVSGPCSERYSQNMLCFCGNNQKNITHPEKVSKRRGSAFLSVRGKWPTLRYRNRGDSPSMPAPGIIGSQVSGSQTDNRAKNVIYFPTSTWKISLLGEWTEWMTLSFMSLWMTEQKRIVSLPVPIKQPLVIRPFLDAQSQRRYCVPACAIKYPMRDEKKYRALKDKANGIILPGWCPVNVSLKW